MHLEIYQRVTFHYVFAYMETRIPILRDEG